MTPEQHRIEQIKRKWQTAADGPIKSDIDFLLSLVKSQEASSEDDLHLAICQAVHLMNQGDLHAGHDLLRQTLVDYADKKALLSRSEIVRQQQRSGSQNVSAVMVSPTAAESPYCNRCQAYHPQSQPCFDAATTPRRNAPLTEALPQSKAYQDAEAVEAKLKSVTSAHSRILELMNYKLGVATSMRSACVGKVREIEIVHADACAGPSNCSCGAENARQQIYFALESVSIQEQEKQ